MLSNTNVTSMETDGDHRPLLRKKRRPPLACEQCRRRKVKCDLLVPCRPCTKTFRVCRYVQDSRPGLTTAPFQPNDTRFSVFDQNSRQLYTPISQPSISDEIASGSLSPEAFPLQDLTAAPRSLSPIVTGALDIPSETSGFFHDQGTSQEQDQMSLRLDSQDYMDGDEFKLLPLASLIAATKSHIKGAFFKTRFHGQSSWLNYVLPHSEALTLAPLNVSDEPRKGQASFAECKVISREIKMRESRIVPFSESIRDLIPNRALSDRLVQAYLRTLQPTFGVVYVPSFRKDYKDFWLNPACVDEEFGIALLLIMCIGSAFCESSISRATTLRWIKAASSWLSLSKEKSRLNLNSLRVQCLYLLARQVKSVAGDLAWLSTGSLVRSAVQMGMHIDPENYPLPLSPWEEESRRRLWAAILELEVQASMDCGTVPSVDSSDFDCASPSNIDDISLQSSWPPVNRASAKPMDEPTQSSTQILLMMTMPVRIKIARFLNCLRSEGSFEETLRLSAELLAVMEKCSEHLNSYCMSSMPPAAFQTKLFRLMVDRFLISLHHPFANSDNPLHYYSRKTCLETSLSLFSYWASPTDDDFYRLRLSGTGMFRDVYTQIALYLCRALVDQLKIDKQFPMNHDSRANVRRETRDAVELYLELAEARLGEHERNVNFHILVSCLLAQADATEAGTPVEPKVSQALEQSLQTCSWLLKKQSRDLVGRDDGWSDLLP